MTSLSERTRGWSKRNADWERVYFGLLSERSIVIKNKAKLTMRGIALFIESEDTEALDLPDRFWQLKHTK